MNEDTSAVKEEVQAAALEQEAHIDYKALLEKETQEKENYRLGLLKAKGKIPDTVIDMDEDKMEDLATRVANKLSPDLKSSLVSTVAKNEIDAKLDKLTANPDEKELIRYHFEFSTAGEDVDARLANAKAIANKDLIAKKASEISLARKRTVNTSMGSSTESGQPQVADDYFTPDQLEDLRKRSAKLGIAFNPTKVKQTIERAKRGEGQTFHSIQ